MPEWFWVLVAVLGVVGIAGFGVSYWATERSHGFDLKPWERVAGLVGLVLLAWSVLLMILGVVIEVAS